MPLDLFSRQRKKKRKKKRKKRKRRKRRKRRRHTQVMRTALRGRWGRYRPLRRRHWKACN
jgi:hypothetical protein